MPDPKVGERGTPELTDATFTEATNHIMWYTPVLVVL